MSTAAEIRQKQAKKLFDNWSYYRHWGMFEDDEENNDDTRALISLFASEHGGVAYLVYAGTNGSMLYRRYNPSEYICAFSCKYITAAESVAITLCEAHDGPTESFYDKLKSVEQQDYLYLIWN